MNSRILAVVTSAAFGAFALANGGTIKGKVSFDGKTPKYKPIQMTADANCAAMHGGKDVRPEYIVVNENGTLRDVFIYVKAGLPADYKAPEQKPIVLDQVGCMYTPHVFGVVAGAPILIRNSDDTSHNIHSLPKNSPEFNQGQPKKGMEMTQSFKNPEMAVKIKCDVHPWMGAWCHVLPHPFFATTGADGTYTITGLPDGEYELEAWTEKLGTQTAKVTISGGATVEHDWKFEKKAKEEKGDE